MTRCAVLLRGVNVGGRNRIAMADLRALLTSIGADEVQTYLQSGNAVVSWPASPDDLATAVADRLRETLDLPVAVLVRTAAELDAVVAGNPFAGEGLDDAAVHAVLLGGPAPQLDVEALLPDRVVVGDRVLYVAYAAGAHSSPAAKLLSSRRFPVVASARNWRTVLALQQLAGSIGDIRSP